MIADFLYLLKHGQEGAFMRQKSESVAKWVVCIAMPLLALSSCQTDPSQMVWRPISPVEPLEMAMAKCDLASMSVEQGFIAYGSPGYVLGAQLGNAISNQMRKNEFIVKCMAVEGYRGEMPDGGKSDGSLKKPTGTKNKHSPGYYPPAPRPM